MNRRQKATILNFLFVVFLTTILVGGVGYWKNHINKSESIRTMKLLSEIVQQYRVQNSRALPSESYISMQREGFGDARLGDIQYRVQWIDFDAGMDTILAYSYKDYGLTVGDGYVVMLLDGTVEWMGAVEFEKLYAEQRSPTEEAEPPKSSVGF